MHDVGHYGYYLMKQRGGDDNESCTVIFIGARHVHGHCGDHLNRFAWTAPSGE
jgi:hypothetical protein